MPPPPLPTAVVLASLLAFAAPLAAQQPLTVGSVTAQPGERISGVIEVPAGTDAGTQIPVTVVNGMAPGPVLALVAGTHGYEYTSIVALAFVRGVLEPSLMRGAVILVHVANPPAFYERRVYRGPDGKNLNRMYPGKQDGTVSERIAHAITTEVIDRASHLIDMHCGDGNEWLRPYTYWQISGQPEIDAAAREMALAYGLDHIVVDRERPRDPAATLYTANTAVWRGKPAITTESGGLGQTDDEAVNAHARGALSVIAHLGILEVTSARVERPLYVDRTQVVTSPQTGIWRSRVKPMQSVAAGTLLGTVSDPYGNLLNEVRAPFAGEVFYVVATPPVSAGEPLAFIGTVSEAEPKL